jgi:hypothetical protein
VTAVTSGSRSAGSGNGLDEIPARHDVEHEERSNYETRPLVEAEAVEGSRVHQEQEGYEQNRVQTELGSGSLHVRSLFRAGKIRSPPQQGRYQVWLVRKSRIVGVMLMDGAKSAAVSCESRSTDHHPSSESRRSISLSTRYSRLVHRPDSRSDPPVRNRKGFPRTRLLLAAATLRYLAVRGLVAGASVVQKETVPTPRDT